MSGIIGLVNFTPQGTNNLGKAIAEQLCRFEWNTLDWWTSDDQTIALGRVDIGIFNPKPQPVQYSDRSVIVFFSGELHNVTSLQDQLEKDGYKFIRGDDPELVLHAYTSFGLDFIHHLEGAFHLLILDLNGRELIIANDRYGLRPLYWAQYNGKFAFAPEIKALLFDPEFEKRLNNIALAEYVRFQTLIGDKTFFDNIQLLHSAAFLRYKMKEDDLSISTYWSIEKIPAYDHNRSYQDLVSETALRYQNAIKMLSNGPNKVGLYLSGGMDSRSIAACLVKEIGVFDTFTFGDPNSWDVILAKRVSSLLNADHHYYEIVDGKWVLDYKDLHFELTEGFHSWIHCHGISTLNDVRSLIDVNLTGWGPPTMNGNWWDPNLEEAIDETAFLNYLFYFYNQIHTWPGITEAEERTLYTDRYMPQVEGLAFESLAIEAKKFSNLPFNRRADYFHKVNHDRRLTFNFVVFNSSHFENRFPGYNDYSFSDFLFSIPIKIKAKKQLMHDVIEFINPGLAYIPRAKDGLLFTRKIHRRLPHHILTRLKQRTNRHIAPVFSIPTPLYVDFEGWLRNDLSVWANELLLDGRLAERGIFNQDSVHSLLNRHYSGKELHTIGKIAPIMTLEMLFRRFFD